MSTSTFRTAVVRVDAGVLRVEVAQRRPLTDLAAVHDQAAAGRLSGKTVLTPPERQDSPSQRMERA